MSGQVHLSYDDLDTLAQLAKRYAKAFELYESALPRKGGAIVMVPADKNLKDALADLIAEAGAVYAKFAQAGR